MSRQGVQGREVVGTVARVVEVRWDAAVCKPHLKVFWEGEVSGPALCWGGPVGAEVLPEEELVLGQLPVEEVNCPGGEEGTVGHASQLGSAVVKRRIG